MLEVSAATIARALKLLATQQKASRAYYERNKDRIRQRSAAYWAESKVALNAGRRERARLLREAAAAAGKQQHPASEGAPELPELQ